MTRPEGQPGNVWAGEERESWDFPGETVVMGLRYPAVKGDTLWIWRDGSWIEAPGYVDYFEPGPEWQARCDHEHQLPWRTCDTEAECLSLRREEHRVWGDRR
jgi:hypothetical protein